MNRGLAEVVCEEPYTIRLNFEPKGRGHDGEPFYLTEKVNQCVRCGSQDDLTGHHVVPICFRRWFPHELKSRSSHDILILCPNCHHAYERIAWQLKQKLFQKIKGDEEILSPKAHLEMGAIGAAVALSKWADKMPPDRQEVLRQKIRDYLGKQDITQKDMWLLGGRRNSRLQPRMKDTVSKKVVEQLIREPTWWQKIYDKIPLPARFRREPYAKIKVFVKMWRQHFVTTMKPQYLPPFWDVNHRI